MDFEPEIDKEEQTLPVSEELALRIMDQDIDSDALLMSGFTMSWMKEFE